MGFTRKTLVIFLAATLTLSTAVATEKSPVPVSELSALRKQLGWSRDYLKRCNAGRPLNEIYELIGEQKWFEVTKQSEMWLEQCPIDIRIHTFAAIGFSELGITERSNYHTDAWQTLMDDIFASGKGTRTSPVEVISVSEEYDVLFILRAKLKRQRVVQGEVAMDEIEFTTQNGKAGKLYFNPAAHLQRLIENRAFDDMP